MFRTPNEFRSFIDKLSKKNKKNRVIDGGVAIQSIDTPFKHMFDVYFLFYILGTICNKQYSVPSDAPEMIKTFPESYVQHRDLLLGFIIWMTLIHEGSNLEDKKNLRKLVREVLKSEDPRTLTSGSFKSMNQFAYGGYRYFITKYPGTTDPAFVLIRCIELLLEGVKHREEMQS